MEAVKKRILELKIEADRLVKQREHLYKSIADIDIRLHQIVGAVDELNKICIQGDDSEGRDDNQPRIPKSTDETE